MIDYKTQIHALLNNLNCQFPKLDAETYGIQMFGAPRLNVFSLFGPDERRVTTVLADLLNPEGRHGQDRLFLNIFLRAVDLPESRRHEWVSIATDDLTSDGRLIDITVKTETALLGIEVKLWAAQQKNQLSHYAAELEKEALKSRCRWKLLFLADQKPETAEDKVIRMPWATPLEGEANRKPARPLIDIFTEALPNIRAPRTRAFLEDFLDWIGENFGGRAMNNSEFEAYTNAACDAFDDKASHRAIGALMLAQDKLHCKVLNAIGDAIFEGLTGYKADFAVENANDLSTTFSKQYGEWLLRRPHWPSNLHLGLSSERNNFNLIIFGVKAPDGADQRRNGTLVSRQKSY